MAISSSDLSLLRSTRSVFSADSEATGRAFYSALFERDPDLRPLFPDDLSDQSRKLATTIAVVIDSARDWDRLSPVLENLARRHLAYRVRPEHYETVGLALIDALKAMGTNAEALDAWARTYDVISHQMITHAYPSR